MFDGLSAVVIGGSHECVVTFVMSSLLAVEGRRLAVSSSLADCSLSRRRGGFIASAEGSSFSAVLPVGSLGSGGAAGRAEPCSGLCCMRI